MKRIVFISVFLFLTTIGNSQELNSLGARVGYFVGFDFKHFFSNTKDFAFQLHLDQRVKNAERTEVTRFTGVLVFQQPLRSRRIGGKLFYFYGAGVHYGFGHNDVELFDENPIRKTETGVDATVGIEFSSKRVPFNFAMDFTPYYNFKRITTHQEWVNIGISMRYRF